MLLKVPKISILSKTFIREKVKQSYNIYRLECKKPMIFVVIISFTIFFNERASLDSALGLHFFGDPL